MNLYHFLFLPVLGIFVGAAGTTLGIGGGFILVPALILLFPEAPAATVTSISLAVVFLNAVSGSAGYIREGRVDVRSGVLFAIAAVPAAVLGAFATAKVGRVTFDAAFGTLMIAGAVYLLWRNRIIKLKRVRDDWPATNRVLLDKSDCIYRYNVNEPLGMGVSAAAGVVSSFFGIGGGVIQLPVMVALMKIPPPIAAGTSMFVLIFTALTGVITHIVLGEFNAGWRRAGLIGFGAVIGAQIGVRLAKRVDSGMLVMVLSIAMVVLGVRQIIAAFV